VFFQLSPIILNWAEAGFKGKKMLNIPAQQYHVLASVVQGFRQQEFMWPGAAATQLIKPKPGAAPLLE
jgi:hypothetical protein